MPEENANQEEPSVFDPAGGPMRPVDLNDNQSVFTPGSGPADDALARREAIAIETGSLEADAKQKEHGRHQKFRDHINIATLVVFWTVMSCLVVSIIIFTFHMISPDSWHFLNEAQIGTLKTLLGGAILSSAMSGYVNNRMKE